MHFKSRFFLLVLILVTISGSNTLIDQISKVQVLDLVNKDRVSRGLEPLNVNESLNLAAMAKAQDMIRNNYFSHNSPDGKKPWQWFTDLGYNYSYAGENLARGFTDAFDLEESWMQSPDHRANILSPFYSEAGLAVVNDGGKKLVVQFFGSRDNKVTIRY